MSTRLKNGQYYVVNSWMISELGLKGNELAIYAIIYGFSQEEGQRFTGSLQYLADWTNSTKRGVMKCLNSLVSKGIIQKIEKRVNNIKFCEYYATQPNATFQQNVVYTMEQNSNSNTVYTMEQSSNNNINNSGVINNIHSNYVGSNNSMNIHSTYEGSNNNIHSTYVGSKVDIGSNSMNIHSTYVGTNNNNNYNNKNNYNNNTTITNVIVNENDNEIDNDINNDNDIIVPRIVPRIDECVNDDKKVVVKEEKNITTTVSKVGVNEDLKLLFNKFWTSYPKKVGKPKCEEWFKKNKVDEGLLNLMLESIENWKQTQQWQKDNGQYIPNPLTWLNRNGWEDEVPNIKTNNANGLDYSQVDPKFLAMMFE